MPLPLDAETTARIIAADELGDKTRMEIAEQFQVAPSTVTRVMHEYQARHGLTRPVYANIAERVAQVVDETVSLIQLQQQIERMAMSDPEWISKQAGRDLAAMFFARSREARAWLEFAHRHAGGPSSPATTGSERE